MIAARGRDHARSGDIAHQQVGEGAPGLEGSGVLQRLQLEDQADAVEAEIGAFDFKQRSAPDMRTDEGVSAGNAAGRDLARHAAIITGSYVGASASLVRQRHRRVCAGAQLLASPAPRHERGRSRPHFDWGGVTIVQNYADLGLALPRPGRYHHRCFQRPCSLAGPPRPLAPDAIRTKIIHA